MTHNTAFHTLRQALADWQRRQIALTDFCDAWRSQNALLEALPARYRDALEDLLGRLESAAPFAENCCCTLDQGDLLANFGRWLDRAQQTLAAEQAR